MAAQRTMQLQASVHVTQWAIAPSPSISGHTKGWMYCYKSILHFNLYLLGCTHHTPGTASAPSHRALRFELNTGVATLNLALFRDPLL